MEALETAKTVALNYVAARMRTSREVQEFLRKKGYEAELIQEVIVFLQSYQYLDDAAYCRSWIHDRVQFHPCGRQKLAFDLSKKITNRQLIAESLAEHFPAELELELAVAAALRKLNSSRSALSKAQLSRFLQSRGYGSGIISKALQDEEVVQRFNQKQTDNNF